MAEQFIRDLVQKLADHNVEVADWYVSKSGAGALVTLTFCLDADQSGMFHVIDQKTTHADDPLT